MHGLQLAEPRSRNTGRSTARCNQLTIAACVRRATRAGKRRFVTCPGMFPRQLKNIGGGLMRMLVLAVLALLSAVPLAGAQVCGDVNGDGAVTVTDGVLVLRSAAGLPANVQCAPAPNPTATPPPQGSECTTGNQCLQQGRFIACLCSARHNPGCTSSTGIIEHGQCEGGTCVRGSQCVDDLDCDSLCAANGCGLEGVCLVGGG